MNRKGFELAISALVLIILGILVLAGLIYAFTGGFKKFTNTTDLLLDSADGVAIKQACQLGCDSENKIIYCCREFVLNDQKLKCSDERLELECNLDCSDFNCDNK